jgi:hypothetical protein
MNMTLDLYTIKWATTNYYDIIQVYKSLDKELCYVREQYSKAMDPVRKAYFQGAMKGLVSAEEKLLETLVDLLQEQGYISTFDDVSDNYEIKLQKARPIMELLVQELWNE